MVKINKHLIDVNDTAAWNARWWANKHKEEADKLKAELDKMEISDPRFDEVEKERQRHLKNEAHAATDHYKLTGKFPEDVRE